MAAPKLDIVPDIVRGPRTSPLCHECPLAGADGKPLRPVAGEGAAAPRWIALGEGPGNVEAMEGRPFVGPSGRMFQRALKATNVERHDIWITNTTLCLPKQKTDTEMRRARECCAPRLREELAQFPDVPVLTLGAIAAHATLGDTFSINQLASSLNDVDVDGTGPRAVIPTHHPARILRGGDGQSMSDRAVDTLYLNLVYDTAKVNALGLGHNVRFTDDIQYEAHDVGNAEALMAAMFTDVQRLKHCAIDVETDGLNARKVNLTAIAVATTEWALSLAYPTCWTPPVWRLFRQIANAEDITKVFHNRQYDELVLLRYGIVMNGPVHDTLLKHHAAFPGSSHKLQDVATQFFAIRPWKAEFRRGTDEKGKAATIDDLLKYNARDTLVTARLDVTLDECITQTNSHRCYDTDNALAPIAMQMEIAGIPVDQRRRFELKKHFDAIIKRTRAEIEHNANDPAIYDRFVDQLALTRAITKRKNDPPDFLTRHQLRYDQLRNGLRRKKPLPGEWYCPTCGAVGEGFELPPACCRQSPVWQREPLIYLKGKEPVAFSVSNADHIGAYLKARGHRLYRVTAGGKTCTSKDVLEELTHIADVRTILEFREAAKLNSTFVEGLPVETDARHQEKVTIATTDAEGRMLVRAIRRWGRLHSSWDIHKITGRWGSSPNVQNWPKALQKRNRPNLRTQVVAPPGRLLVGADYAQLEARIIGMLSGDPFLVSVFMANYGACDAGCRPDQEPVKFCPVHDLHTVFSIEVFAGFMNYGKEERKELRDLVKRGEYGGFYGGSVETLYASIVKEMPDVTLADVARIVQVIASRMPGVETWHQQLVRDAMSGEIRSAILGRRRTFPLGNGELSVIYNFPVQATGADIVDLGILRLVPELPDDCHLILQGHDAIVLDVPEDIAEDVAPLVTECLSQEFEVNGTKMFYPANAAIDKCWANV